jgi:hypothetical protein
MTGSFVITGGHGRTAPVTLTVTLDTAWALAENNGWFGTWTCGEEVVTITARAGRK